MFCPGLYTGIKLTAMSTLKVRYMKQNKKAYAVIYPAASINAYGAIWSLGKVGIPVIALSPVDTPHFRSRFVEEHYITPDAARDTGNFVEFLVGLGKLKRTKSVLYMMEDVYAYIASAYVDELEPHYYYPYLTKDQLIITLNKKAMYQAAYESGIQQPRTWFPNDARWAERNAGNLTYPVIIKPLVSRFSFNNKSIEQVLSFPDKYGKAIKIKSSDELLKLLPQVSDEGFSVCVQQQINCKIDNLFSHKFYCGANGEILASFTGRKLHQEPPDFGTGVIAKAEINPDIVEESKKFLKKIAYRGIGSIEYIKTTEDYKFIEINPRAYFWQSLSTASGVNLYQLMYEHLTGESVDLEKYVQRSNQILWYDAGRLRSFIGFRNKTISLTKFLLSPKMEAVINLNDPKVSIIRIIKIAKRVPTKLLKLILPRRT